MRIKTQSKIAMFLFGAVLCLVVASVLWTGHKVEKAGEQEKIADYIDQGTSELGYLTNDYLIYGETQQLTRWQLRFASFSGLVESLDADRPEQQVLVRNIKTNQKRLKEVFDSVTSTLGGSSSNQGAPFDRELLQVSWSRMAVQIQAITSDASRLSQLFRLQAERLKQINMYVVFAMIGLFCAYFLLNYFMIQRRTLTSIAILQAGTAIIGSGNLDFVIEEKRNDEIGDLSRSFNRMTADLKAVTASKADLEREIAERRKVEEELREQRELLRVTLSSIGDAVLTTDTGGLITYLNPVAQSLTGWKLQEASGQPVAAVFRIINEKTREPAENVVERVLREGRTVSLANHTALVTSNGREIPIEDSAAPIMDEAGNLVGVVLVFHDVTEKRRALEAIRQNQERFIRIFNYSPEPLALMSFDDARIEEANQAYCSLLGFSTEEAIGKTSRKLGIWSDPNELKRVRDLLVSEGKVRNFECRLRTKSSEIKTALISVDTLEMSGRPHVLFSVKDITERKQMEEELRRSRDELELRVQERTEELRHTVSRLELINQELQEFAFVASHDLQEPLRKIQTFCGMVQKRCAADLDSTGKEYLDRVLNSASRMRQLLRDLLLFSRVASKPEPFKKIDLSDIAREAADIFEASAGETGCRIEIENLPAIEADESQMLQLFQNLIGNALKYRGAEAPRINVYGKFDMQGICEICVKDNGIGFDPQFAERIFKPFQRLHGQSQYDGTGMGLAICRKIVERHGGTIKAESEPGKGSTFTIRLPAKQSRLEYIATQ